MDPKVTKTEMTDQGYWQVTVSVRPDRRTVIVVPKTGITPNEASELALLTLGNLDAPRRRQ